MMASKMPIKKSSWATEVEEEHQLTGWASIVCNNSEDTRQQNGQNVATAVPKIPGKSKKSKKKGKGAANQNNLKLLPEQIENNVRGKPFLQSPEGKIQVRVDYASKRPSDNWSADFPTLPGQNLKAEKEPGPSRTLNGAWEQKQPLTLSLQSRWGSNQLETDHNTNLASTSTTSAKTILEALLPSERVGLSEGFNTGGSSNLSNTRPINRIVEIVPPDLNDVFSAEELPAHATEDLDSGDGDLDSDSDWISGEDYDSNASEKSHESQKRNKVFCAFFRSLDALPPEELEKESRQWHCPACKGGPGAIDWYRGFQPLLNHAKTVKKKVKLHRTFHKILENDLSLRQASAASGMFGMWKGLRGDEEVNNPLIVWPPMVVIQNTKLDQDAQDKWIGMGSKELLDHFKDYNVMKARHSYGPQGYRGMSMVIFADSPAGYFEAQRLDQHFRDARRGREFWDKPSKLLFYHGGQRILYGYLPVEEDLKIFNKHSKVLEPMRNIDEDTQQIYRLKYKVEREKEHENFQTEIGCSSHVSEHLIPYNTRSGPIKNLEKAFTNVSRKLRLREEEVQVINRRALEQTDDNQTQMDDLEHHQKRLEDIIMGLHKKLHIQEQDIKVMQSKAVEQNKQNKEEMEALEQSYWRRISQLKSAICEKEQAMQKVQEKFQEDSYQRYQELEEQHSTLCLNVRPSEDEQQKKQAKLEEMSRESEMIEMSLKDVKDYETMKMQLEKDHHLRRLDFKRKQLEEEMAFQQKFEEEKLELLEKYKPT
ncbi:hypothetical protein O6H91_23G020200 [Diphasiastrum complanatum]|uniref:Uncharacterized protein n=1 Tax=Diphasiastrum complanatum TaxID=34168 RepID=A0ACC2A8Q8_DIPCM|nr:hypothetical protein O6H91_23G020200 [Diphasiastrum complanatum]